MLYKLMTKNFLFTVLLLLSYYYSYTQEQTPAIEWIEPYNGGNRGGSITTFPGPNVLFALIKGQNSISGTASISKFYVDGLVKHQYIFAEGGSSNAPAMSQYASQDGGVLVYLFFSKVLRKYDSDLNLSWEKPIDFSIQFAKATLTNGFYIVGVDNNNIALKRMKSDGSIEWSVDITEFANKLVGIQTTNDDEVIIGGLNGIRKYSASGELVWKNKTILFASALTKVDSSIFYVYLNSSAMASVTQLNTSNGEINWTKLHWGEDINNFERTSDNGCVFSTSTGLYKYDSTGNLQWKNVDYGSSIVTASDDGKLLVLKKNAIAKLTLTNEQLWTKSFNSDYYTIQNMHSASDSGLYVSAVKNGIHYNTAPDYLLFKLAAPKAHCKTNFHIVGEDTTYCEAGILSLSSKISNVPMEYMSYLTSFSFQWFRDNTVIESANVYAYTATQTGNYFVQVRQEGCVASTGRVALNIVSRSAPIIESDKAIVCAGMSTTLKANGCDGTVVWSTGARGQQVAVILQATTTYDAICEKMVNNELCQSGPSNKIIIFVKDSSNLKIDEIKGNKVFCENSSTDLTASIIGGKAPFLYKWTKEAKSFSQNKDITINEEGSYIFSVIDSMGCETHSDTLKIRKSSNPVVPIINSPVTTEICNNGSIILTTAAKENAYQWLINDKEIEGAMNQFYTAIAPGKYQVKVTNTDNCSSISGNSITVLQHLVLQPSIRQSGDSLISSAVAGNKWYLNGNELPITAQKIKFTEVGIYQVKVIEKGCESALSVTFLPIALANEHETAHIQIYPNPASDKAFIKSSKVFSYQLIDVTGRLLSQSTTKSFSHTIDLNRFSSGNYFVILQEEAGNHFVRKLSVNH